MSSKRNPAPPAKPTGRLMSQSAAARALGVSRATVLAWVASGELAAETMDEGTPVILRDSVERAMAKRQSAAA